MTSWSFDTFFLLRSTRMLIYFEVSLSGVGGAIQLKLDFSYSLPHQKYISEIKEFK